MSHALTRVSVISADPAMHRPLLDYLAGTGFSVSEGRDGEVVLVLGAAGLADDVEDALLSGPAPTLVVGPTMSTALTDAAGLVPGRLTPVHEIRVRPGVDAGDVASRMGGDLLVVSDRWPLQDKVADDVEVLLTANVGFTEHPVATWRPEHRGRCAHRRFDVVDVRRPGLAAHRAPAAAAGHRSRRRAAGARRAARLRRDRARAQRRDHPHRGPRAARGVRPRPGAHRGRPRARTRGPRRQRPARDDGVDLVIVSTPPNTHAEWVLRCLDAGKSVVVEKPFCLTVAEADRRSGRRPTAVSPSPSTRTGAGTPTTWR